MLSYSVDGYNVTVTTDDAQAELAQLQDDVSEHMPASEALDFMDRTSAEQFAAGVTFEFSDDGDLDGFIDLLDGLT